MSPSRFRIPMAVTALIAASLVAGCTQWFATSQGQGQPPPAAGGHVHGGGGRSIGPESLGVVDQAFGYALTDVSTPTEVGVGGALTFRITGPDGTHKDFDADQTKLMHVYIVRKDLAEFLHLHPVMEADGTWKVPLTWRYPGEYRVVASFLPKAAGGAVNHMVFGRDVQIAGDYTAQPLPVPESTATVDGYTLTVTTKPKAGSWSLMSVRVTRDGHDVTDLQTYLDTYAHVTGFHRDSLAVTHLHPYQLPTPSFSAPASPDVAGPIPPRLGGPELRIAGLFPSPGLYRLFIQFQTEGTVRTAPITIDVR